jgi:hypothetical protein
MSGPSTRNPAEAASRFFAAPCASRAAGGRDVCKGTLQANTRRVLSHNAGAPAAVGRRVRFRGESSEETHAGRRSPQVVRQTPVRTEFEHTTDVLCTPTQAQRLGAGRSGVRGRSARSERRRGAIAPIAVFRSQLRAREKSTDGGPPSIAGLSPSSSRPPGGNAQTGRS